jgi:hypothetical protein
VPSVSDGTYAVTAKDTSGNRASSNLSVNAQPIPEGLSIGALVFLSFVVVSVGSYLGKCPKVRNNNPPIS